YFIRGFALGDNTSPGTRGPSINESEVNFHANVDPYLFGNLTVAFEPNNTISIEEAFMQTTGLPAGFTLRAGRFFSGIGYLNEPMRLRWVRGGPAGARPLLRDCGAMPSDRADLSDARLRGPPGIITGSLPQDIRCAANPHA